MAAVPVLVLCHRFQSRYQRIVRRIQDQTGDLTTTIEEGAKGIRVLKAFGRAQVAYEGYQRESQAIHDTQMERIALHTRFVWVLGIIPNLTLTVVLLGGVLAVGSGSLSLGGLVAFVSYVLMLTFPIEILAWIMAMAGEAESAAVRIYEVFDTEPAIQDRPGAIELGVARGAISLRARVVHLRRRRATRARPTSTSRVEPGEAIAIVGATGAGKTALVTLLTRLHDPTTGRITLDGHDLRDLTVTSLRRQVGFAFEEPSLFSASVRENLLMGKPDATEAELLAALEVAQARFALDLPWGLDTRIGEQGLSLSGGQRQRLALARAIVGRPRILVLDDPLSAVDVHTEAAVQAALRPWLEDCTVFIVVHRPSTVALADRCLLLHDGRVVAVGTHHDLLATEPRYRAVLSEDAEVVDDLELDDLIERGGEPAMTIEPDEIHVIDRDAAVDLTGDALVDEWRGVNLEDEDEVTGGLAGLLRSRSRALLGDLVRPHRRARAAGIAPHRAQHGVPAGRAVADPARHRRRHPSPPRRRRAARSGRSSRRCWACWWPRWWRPPRSTRSCSSSDGWARTSCSTSASACSSTSSGSARPSTSATRRAG